MVNGNVVAAVSGRRTAGRARRPAPTKALWLPIAALGLIAVGCRQEGREPVTALRLVDLYKPESVEGRAAPATPPARTERRFDGASPEKVPAKLAATHGWEAGPGVTGLAVRGGRLRGRTTSDFPLLHLDWPEMAGGRDTVHAVEVRMRVSAGQTIGLDGRDSDEVDLAAVVKEAKDWPWDTTAKLTPGDTVQTVTLRSPRPTVAPRHWLLRPTDAAGAEFEVESVRVVSRREHLAGIPSGVSWQGLDQIYRETLVARAPEEMRFEIEPPRDAFLDLGLGTVEDGPVTFRVALETGDGSAGSENGAPEPLLERTVTTPHRWEPVSIDLRRFAGRRGRLVLSLHADREGALGFWGSPAIRARRAARAAAPSTSSASSNGAPPRGVILVWADTLRRDHLGAYGYGRATSPVLDRFAAEGALFRSAITPGTWTKVATPSLLSSLHPSSHGVLDFSHRLPAAATTLAEVYRAAGYSTLSMSSILFTGQFTNLHQGFEEVHEDSSLPDRRSSKTARVYVDRLLPWLDAHRDVPFFVLLHVSDPHDPYEPAAPYTAMWSDPRGKDDHERESKEVRAVIGDPLLRVFGMPTRAELEQAGFDADAYVDYDRGWYDGSILAMDAEMGRLLERLRELGLDHDTLIVFVGDHGEEFLEHGRTFHGQTTYGELANVPLMARWPAGLGAGQVVEETVSIIDLMPTLLEVSGLDAPAEVQGQSLLSLISPRAARPFRERPVLIEKHRVFEPVGGPPPRDTESFAYVASGWKLVHNTVRTSEGPEFELYDARQDPLDARDVAAANPDVVVRLAKELAAFRGRVEAARLRPDADAAKSLSPEELERLRSLGYIQ